MHTKLNNTCLMGAIVQLLQAKRARGKESSSKFVVGPKPLPRCHPYVHSTTLFVSNPMVMVKGVLRALRVLFIKARDATIVHKVAVRLGSVDSSVSS